MTIPELVTLLAAFGAFAVSLAGAFVSVWNAVHIGQVHTLVNGQSQKLEAFSRSAGFAEGAASVGKAPTENPENARQT